jgi:hypothetical protein
MSNFISNTEQVETRPVLNSKMRKVSFNPYAFRPSALTPLPVREQQRQELYLKDICKNINLE